QRGALGVDPAVALDDELGDLEGGGVVDPFDPGAGLDGQGRAAIDLHHAAQAVDGVAGEGPVAGDAAADGDDVARRRLPAGNQVAHHRTEVAHRFVGHRLGVEHV